MATKATATETPEIETPEFPEYDPCQAQLDEYKNQVESLENFLNVVVTQRNEAQNQSAQFQSQLLKLQRQIQQGA